MRFLHWCPKPLFTECEHNWVTFNKMHKGPMVRICAACHQIELSDSGQYWQNGDVVDLVSAIKRQAAYMAAVTKNEAQRRHLNEKAKKELAILIMNRSWQDILQGDIECKSKRLTRKSSR